jgi:hypothetical protein
VYSFGKNNDRDALIRKDLVLWRKVVKDANIKPD